MLNYKLPHEQFYTAEPAIVKELKKPALSKIYTYPTDKNIKWYKVFPQYPHADHDKYFFKYQYIKALRIRMNNIQQNLAEEQLRKAIDNEIELNEIKKEERQLLALNNYFKAGLFSFVMTDVKDKYLQNQAKEQMRNNTTLLDIDKQIENIKIDDLEVLRLQEENRLIEQQTKDINEVRNTLTDFIKNYDFGGDEDAKEFIEEYDEVEGEEIFGFETEEVEAEEVDIEAEGEVTTAEKIAQKLKDIGERGREDIRKEREKLGEAGKFLDEREKGAVVLKEKVEKLKEHKENVEDLKKQVKDIKSINKLYDSRIKSIIKKIDTFDNFTGRLHEKTTPKVLKDQIALALTNRYITEEEYKIMMSNFPDTKGSTPPERIDIRRNFKDLFKTLRSGEKVDIRHFIDGIKHPAHIKTLEKEPFDTPYTKDKLQKLIKDIDKYGKLNVPTGIKGGKEQLSQGDDLIELLEKSLDLETLIPNISQGALYEDEPPTSPRDYDSEGGA
jgi:hypothetical protein